MRFAAVGGVSRLKTRALTARGAELWLSASMRFASQPLLAPVTLILRAGQKDGQRLTLLHATLTVEANGERDVHLYDHVVARSTARE